MSESNTPQTSGWYWIEDEEITSGDRWVMAYLEVCVGEPNALHLYTPFNDQETWHLVEYEDGEWLHDTDYSREAATECKPLQWVPIVNPKCPQEA